MARTKGATAIPKRKRAEIIGKVNSRLFTPSEIAVQEGRSTRTIQKIVNGEIPADVLAMAKRFEQTYITYADATAMRAQIQAYENISQLSADKAQIVAEKAFNISQIYHNRPTVITQSQDEIAVRFYHFLKARTGWDDEKLEGAIKQDYPNFELKLLGDGK